MIADASAFGQKYLEAIKRAGDVEIVSLVGRELKPTHEVLRKYGVSNTTTEPYKALAQTGVEAVILCTLTQLRAAQAKAGKHLRVEVPLAES